MTLTSVAAPSAFAPTPHSRTESLLSSRERFISYDEVHNRTGLSRTTIWRLEKVRDFPQSVRISPGRRAWREADLDRWIAARLEAVD
jgi:predicted DNA-binding transcriptional regulator AlpA